MRNLDDLCADAIWWAKYGNLGYDQGDRYAWERSGYSAGTEVDCSSFVRGLLKKNGFEVGGFTYTGNESAELCKHGWRRVFNDGSPRKGDILLNDSYHTALYVGNGQLAQASRGEAGHRVSGGAPGDQDGYETNVRSYYDYPWNCYLRYSGTSSGTSDGGAIIRVDGLWGRDTNGLLQHVLGTREDHVISGQPISNRPLLPGCTGGWEWVPDDRATGSLAIAALQERIGADPDGKLGPQSIGLLQVHYHVDVDHVLSCPSRTVALMQETLNRGEV